MFIQAGILIYLEKEGRLRAGHYKQERIMIGLPESRAISNKVSLISSG
jgi:hypothetical protein